jgi:hypothetical protein
MTVRGRRAAGGAAGALGAFLACCAPPALGQQAMPLPAGGGDDYEAERPVADARESQRSGTFLPWTLGPAVSAQRALGFVTGGYDAAWSRGLFEAGAEAVVWGALALRAGGSYVEAQDRVRPWFGARAQLLRQGRHGIDGALAVQYRGGGFNLVPAVETSVALGRHGSRGGVFLQATYGAGLQDGERYVDVRVATTRSLGENALVGVEARSQVDLEREWPEPAGEPAYDLRVGPFLSYAFGSYVLTGQAGVGAVKFRASDDSSRTGVLGSVGLGRIF